MAVSLLLDYIVNNPSTRVVLYLDKCQSVYVPFFTMNV